MTWPMVALGEIAQLKWRGEAPEPDQTYRLAGVRWWGEGAYVYKCVTGAETQAKQLNRIERDDLIINKIWARHGSIAVAGDDMAGAYGSSEFPTFVLNRERVEPRFLHWFSKTKSAWSQCELLSRGTSGKNRVKPERFLSILTPLPPLPAQRRIVARLDAAAAAAASRARRASAVEAEIATTLFAAFSRITTDSPRAPMYDVAPLVRRAVTIEPDASYSEIGVRSFYRGIFTRRTVNGEEFDWQKLYRVAEGDLVFSNLMAWEQAIGLAGASHAGSVGNHRMLTCEADRARILPNFLFYYFNTPDGFKQVTEASPGTMARNKTLSTKLLPGIMVPVPPLEAQRWFDTLQAKAQAARAAQADGASELSNLLPAMLNEEFGAGAGA